jgi:hypothetical protein
MSESSLHFDDMQSNEPVSQVSVYDSGDEDIYGDQSDVRNVSTSTQSTSFKFPKNSGASAYLLVNDDNVIEATKLLKVFSSLCTLRLNLGTIFTVCLQRTGFKGDRREVLG